MTMWYVFIPNLFVLLSGAFAFRMQGNDRQFSLCIIQILMCLPLLIVEYFFLFLEWKIEMVRMVLFSEDILSLVLFNTTYRMHRAIAEQPDKSQWVSIGGILLSMAIVGMSAYNLIILRSSDNGTLMPPHSLFSFGQYLLLIAVSVMAWRLEYFWRNSSPVQQWEYKYWVIGNYLVCGAMVWAVSRRIALLPTRGEHFLLLSMLLLFGWSLMIYAVARHRLLNRKFFVSRKMIYTAIAPVVFGIYLIALGIVSLIMQFFGLTMPYVLKWLLFAAGLVVLMSLIFSGKVRHQIKFFVSTHFYTNKYEYRDEWLAFSRLLQGALTEPEIVSALHQILANSLYTNKVYIWLGDDHRGYPLVLLKGSSADKGNAYYLPPDDPLIGYLKTNPYLYTDPEENAHIPQSLIEQKQFLFAELMMVLCVPLTIGEHLVGVIGLGPEFTGGKYGNDDFDLLTALGTQAASAILGARMAEEIVKARQQETWDIMSAFILHDIKNAASMLSLVRHNAPSYIHLPEFQQDMLDTIDDALKRMNRVQSRLAVLKGEIIPVWQEVDLCLTLQESCRRLMKRLQGIQLNFHCENSVCIKTDPELLERITENLLLNAFEAGGAGTTVDIISRYDGNHHAVIELTDNGPGIPPELLPNALFEPFKTTKPKGSGIGLWQVKQLIISLNGEIAADNPEAGGARFLLKLPVKTTIEKSCRSNELQL